MLRSLTDFHTFDPNNYVDHVYEALTFSGDMVPVRPDSKKLMCIVSGKDIPLETVYKVRVLTDDDKYDGIQSSWNFEKEEGFNPLY